MEVKPKTRKYREFEQDKKARISAITNSNIEYSDERYELMLKYCELTEKIENAKKRHYWDDVKILKAEQRRIECALEQMTKSNKRKGLFGGLFKK